MASCFCWPLALPRCSDRPPGAPQQSPAIIRSIRRFDQVTRPSRWRRRMQPMGSRRASGGDRRRRSGRSRLCPRACTSWDSVTRPRASQRCQHVAPARQDGVATHHGASPALGHRRPVARAGAPASFVVKRCRLLHDTCSVARSLGSRTASDSNWQVLISSPECGQQVAQPYVEQLFRDTVATSELVNLVTGVVVLGVTEYEKTRSSLSSRTSERHSHHGCRRLRAWMRRRGKHDAPGHRRDAPRGATTRARISTLRSAHRTSATGSRTARRSTTGCSIPISPASSAPLTSMEPGGAADSASTPKPRRRRPKRSFRTAWREDRNRGPLHRRLARRHAARRQVRHRANLPRR